MRSETHNVEWKQSWHDEYLKWICGFANADGGALNIGKDDDGRTVGVKAAKRLMEDIPNKIQSNLGIVCDVRLLTEGEGDVVEIRVDRSPYPVNYRGEFHYRSGATKQVLKGNSNVAVLPRNLTVEKLLGMHRSEPYNPLIAEAFYRAGYIESWGRGIDKVRRACEANGNLMAHFELDDSGVSARVDLPDWWEMDRPATTDDATYPDFKSDFKICDNDAMQGFSADAYVRLVPPHADTAHALLES